MSSFSDRYNNWLKKNNKTQEQNTNSYTTVNNSNSESTSSFQNRYNKWLEEQEKKRKKQQEREDSIQRVSERKSLNTYKQQEMDRVARESEENRQARKEQVKQSEKKVYTNEEIKKMQKSGKSLDEIIGIENKKQDKMQIARPKDTENLTTVKNSDVKAYKQAKKLNQALEDKDYASAIAFVGSGFTEGLNRGTAGIANAGLSLGALGLESLENRIAKAYEMEEKILNKYGGINTEEGQKLLEGLENTKGFFTKNKDKLLDKAEDFEDRTSVYSKTLPKVNSGIVGTGGQITSAVGEMIPAILSNIVLPGSGAVVSGTQVGGNSAVENLDVGRTNLDKSVLTGTAKGIVAGTVEKLTGGDIISEGFTDKLVAKGIGKTTSNKVVQNVLYKAYQVMGEQAEELLEDDLGNVIDKVINNKDFPTFQERLSQAGETAKVTGLTTLLLNALGLGGGNIDTVLPTANQKQSTLDTVQDVIPVQEQNMTPMEKATNEGSFTKQQELFNNIENNQETLYNNNESESGIDGDIERYINEGRNGLHQEQENNQNREYSWGEYNQWEQSIKPIEEQNLTESERQSIINAKSENNKDIILYDENSNDNTYSGGASQKVKNKIVISKQKAEIFGLTKMIDHETAESDILHNEIANDILTPIIETIEKDTNFTKQKDLFWEGQEGNVPSNKLIAKDILCDRFSELKNGEKLDYENILSNATNSSIDMALNNYYKQVYGKELGASSSFYVENNKNIAPSVENNVLPVTKNITRKNISLPKNFANINEELNNNTKDEKIAKVLGKFTNDKMTLKQNKDLLIQKFVNKGHYIDQIAKTTGNKELMYKYDRMLGAQSEGQYEVGIAQTNNKGEKIGKSINEIWKPAEDSNTVAEFSDYLLHLHNIDRMKKGKPIFGEIITADVSKRMIENYEKLYPNFKNWSKDIHQFNKNQLRNTTEAGLTSEELEILLDEMYSNYVTISRTKDSNTIDRKNKVVSPNKIIKKAVGGNTDIQPLKDAMAKQAIAVKQAIRRNDVGLELLNVFKTYEDTDSYDINNVLNQDKNGSYLIVFKNGKAKRLKITEGIYESLKPSQKYKIEDTIPLKLVQKASGLQRSLLTVDNPVFMITNFFKDFQDGMFNSKYSSKFIKNYGKALSEIKNKGKYYEEYMGNGGNSNTYFDYEKGIKKEKKIDKFLNKIRTGNEIIEMAPRLSEYISTREAGGSINEALYNSAEITTNFKRGGDIAKAINRNGANFLNASIQGLSKQIRNFTGQKGVKGYVNLLSKATFLSVVPSVLNHLLLGDDEDYEDLPDYVKDTYYLFKIGDNKFIRIPKGRVLSIFGSAARRTLEYAEGNEKAFIGLKDTIINQMAPNNPLSDNVFAPIIQASKNETWYGGDLVPTRLKDELPENQYDESTDNFSKWLGKLIGISPIKINYVIDQYSGGVGDILLPMMTPQAENNVLTDKFTIDSVLKNKNVSEFYETLDKQTKISNAPEATDEDLLKTKYLNTIQASVSDLYKEKREVQLSDSSDTKKKEQVKKIQKEINDILEEGLKQYDKGKIYSNYATIGDEEYYKITNIKNGTKEWNKLSEEEKEKNKNISLKTYASYKENVIQKTISQRNTGEIKENGNIKDRDKIQILLDNNYSNMEKKALYENYILDSDDKKYKIIKETFTSSGLNITKYLEYKSQEFSADKKDDGTLNGKSISGSKKKKVWDYIEDMDISYTQKIILYGLEYTPSNREQAQIVNYISSLPNKKRKEKLEMLEQFQGFTIYKNGTFKY